MPHVRPYMPRSVWALGFVSMFSDISSETIHSLLPVFLVGTLGASVSILGLIEGVAEALALVIRIFSGVISDILGRRKPLIVIGYALAALASPLFPLAQTVSTAVLGRFTDRIGKGIRGAPRDALIGELTPFSIRGASFGLRQSLDAVGAIIGPLMAMGLMLLVFNEIRFVLWIAVVPAVLAVVVLVWHVNEPEEGARIKHGKIKYRELTHLGPRFWKVLLLAIPITLARFSEAFLILKGMSVGMSLAIVPLVLVVMNIAYAASAYPAGRWSDRIDRKTVLAVGMVCLLLADIVLAFANGVLAMLVGAILWGLHMGLSQGLLAAMVTDVTHAKVRGTAFGMFYLISGLVLLLASLIAGLVWDLSGPTATFLCGGAYALIALVILIPHSDTENRESPKMG